MNYKELLERSYKIEKEEHSLSNNGYSVHEYSSDYIFEFTTYSEDISKYLVEVAIDVCQAITDRKTFEFILNYDREIWFITMCNMDFFESKIDWGCSIRGAWWDVCDSDPIVIESCGLFDEKEEQILSLSLNECEWALFIKSVLEFYNENK